MVLQTGSSRCLTLNESAIVKNSVHFMTTLDQSSIVGGGNSNANAYTAGLDSIVRESSSRNEMTRHQTSHGHNIAIALAGGIADDRS